MYPQSNPTYYYPTQPIEPTHNHYLRGAPLSRLPAYPGAPRISNVTLPVRRLSPLADNDNPLPDVPFVMGLVRPLIRGEWREFPALQTSRQRGRSAGDLRGAATLYPVGELLMEVRIAGQSVHVTRIQPADGVIVSVSDVIGAIQAQWQNTRRPLSAGGDPNDGETFRRSNDGRLVWRGLRTVEDDTGLFMLILDI